MLKQPSGGKKGGDIAAAGLQLVWFLGLSGFSQPGHEIYLDGPGSIPRDALEWCVGVRSIASLGPYEPPPLLHVLLCALRPQVPALGLVSAVGGMPGRDAVGRPEGEGR